MTGDYYLPGRASPATASFFLFLARSECAGFLGMFLFAVIGSGLFMGFLLLEQCKEMPRGKNPKSA